MLWRDCTRLVQKDTVLSHQFQLLDYMTEEAELQPVGLSYS